MIQIHNIVSSYNSYILVFVLVIIFFFFVVYIAILQGSPHHTWRLHSVIITYLKCRPNSTICIDGLLQATAISDVRRKICGLYSVRNIVFNIYRLSSTYMYFSHAAIVYHLNI